MIWMSGSKDDMSRTIADHCNAANQISILNTLLCGLEDHRWSVLGRQLGRQLHALLGGQAEILCLGNRLGLEPCQVVVAEDGRQQ